MWKTLASLIQSLLTLTKDVERIEANQKRTDEKVTHLMLAVQRLSDEIRISDQREKSERENLVLQLKIQINRSALDKLRNPTTTSSVFTAKPSRKWRESSKNFPGTIEVSNCRSAS